MLIIILAKVFVEINEAAAKDRILRVDDTQPSARQSKITTAAISHQSTGPNFPMSQCPNVHRLKRKLNFADEVGTSKNGNYSCHE